MAVDTSLVLCYYPSVLKKHIDFIILIVMAACLLITGCGAEEAPVSFETTTVGDSSEAPRTTPSQAEQTTPPALTSSAEAETAAPDTQPVSTEHSSLPVIDPADPDTTETEIPQTTAEPTEPESSTQAATTPSDGKKYVALSFDDGPDMRYTSSTSRILDTLEQYGAKATFFVLATQLDYNGVADEATGETFAERNAKLVKRAYDMGMEIGSHTYNHKNLNTLSASEIENELTSACEKVEAITGAKVKIMRPPYGNANETVRDTIDMPMIIWDVDSLDWESKDPDKIYNEVMKAVRPGSIILMHDIYNTTADGVAKVVPALIDQGYTIVTVSELFEIYGKELKPHNVYMAAWE